MLFLPRFADYAAFWCLQNASFREEKFTATYGSRTRSRVGFNRSNQSDEEHGGLGAPAPLNPPCSLQEQQGVLGIISYHWISIRIQLIAFN